MTNSIREIAQADFILAVGTNTTETHPIISLRVRKALRQGATLAVIDPRQTEMAFLAHYHLQLKPGTDIALLNSLAHVIIKENLWNKKFVNVRTEGFEEFERAVREYSPEYAAGLTGVPAEIIREVARGYAQAQAATILYTMGLTQHVSGTANVLAVANLALLTGQIGREGTGVNPLRGQNNVQGACDMGALPNVYTSYQSVTDEVVRAKFESAWGVALPAKPGLTVGEMFAAAAQGKIKAMYIVGENPVLTDPDANHVVHALENLDFLVVQDLFLTETAQYADVVFPAASFAEKEGTFTNTERRVQRVRKAVAPPGKAKPDAEIISLVARALGYNLNYQNAAQVMDEIACLTPSYAGITYERLEKRGIQWPCPTVTHPGTPILHTERFTRGRGRFHAVEYLPPDELPDENYPLLLNTGRRLFHYHSGSMTRRASGIAAWYPEEFLEVNPQDAAKFGIRDGEKVKLSSRRGEIKIKVKLTEDVPAGMVFTSFHFGEAAVNKLTNPKWDEVAKIPELKVCAVKLEKVS